MAAKRTSRFASAPVRRSLLALLAWALTAAMAVAAGPSGRALAVLSAGTGEQPAPQSLERADTIETADSLATSLLQQPRRQRTRFLQGAAVGGDLLGVALKGLGSDWRQLEAFFRLNLKDEYFPIFELGIGEADHEGLEIENHFHIRAPYFRLGVDYNFANKKHSGNRVLGGIRYGFSSYSYDYDAPGPVQDPVWLSSEACSAHDLSGHLHWVELLVGVETRLWSIVRLGWDVRAKLRASQKAPANGEPWYLPGFGKNTDGLVWGGSFKLVFDI